MPLSNISRKGGSKDPKETETNLLHEFPSLAPETRNELSQVPSSLLVLRGRSLGTLTDGQGSRRREDKDVGLGRGGAAVVRVRTLSGRGPIPFGFFRYVVVYLTEPKKQER